ncbi:hypothetical protein WA158_002146 [Blastocystis sp. Blastoise]
MSSEDKVPDLFTYCANLVVEDWDNKHMKLIFAEQIKHLKPHIAEALLNTFRKKGKLTDSVFCQLIPCIQDSIDISGCDHLRKAAIRQVSFYCQSLVSFFIRSINFSGCKQVTNGLVRQILQCCSRLHVLILTGCTQVTDYAFTSDSSPFTPLIGLYSLRILSLAYCHQLSGLFIPSFVKACYYLHEINLEGCRAITNDNIQKLISCYSFKAVNLSGVINLQDDSISMLLHNDTSSVLTQLSLSNVNISSDTLSTVLPQLKKLKTLELGNCEHLSDSLLINIVKNCSRLSSLDINNCGLLTDTSIQYVLSHLQLSALNVSYCNQLTDEAFKTAQEQTLSSLQYLKITWCTQVSVKGCNLQEDALQLIRNQGIKLI